MHTKEINFIEKFQRMTFVVFVSFKVKSSNGTTPTGIFFFSALCLGVFVV